MERMALSAGAFPVVMLHDIDWPAGRRDMYYFPESIPEECHETQRHARGWNPAIRCSYPAEASTIWSITP
ncbi:hypothetical protein VQ056_06415 [Paenibacillus sp. JTLBN-2024]